MSDRRPNASSRQSAFTLIELLTVIAIIGVLAAIVVGVGRRASGTGKEARTRTELAVLAAALESYRQHYGSYPLVGIDAGGSSADSGKALFAALNGWRGPALTATTFAARKRVFMQGAALTLADPASPDAADNSFVDPWGNPYHYAFNTAASGWSNPSCVLYSCGPDGASAALPSTGIIDATASANLDNLYVQ